MPTLSNKTISMAGGDPPTRNTHRQPVPRRTRESERVRVTRACDRCKKRKTRCTGLQPCRLCVQTASHCTYDTAYLRGNPGVVRPSTYIPNHVATDAPASLLSGLVDRSPVATVPGDSAPADPRQEPTIPAEPISRESPDSMQTDREGHYVGPSSGISFLLRIQKRLDQSVSFSHDSSIFTFGDAPLAILDSTQTDAAYCDPAFYLMLSSNDTTALVERYFDFAVPIDRFLHQPTIEASLREFYDSMGTMHGKRDANARIALLFMVFAMAQAHMLPKPTALNANMSIRYFLAANHHLAREQGTVSLASVQARLCQCLWLLSESRINHCWNLFGTTARLAYAIGLHRKRHPGNVNQIEVECRRRTFWSAYALDNYLSTALGRPRTFHDDDIDQDLPTSVDDNDVHAETIGPPGNCHQSVMFGPVAYAELSRILSLILRNIYTIHPASRADRHAFAIKYTRKLKEWRANMSSFLGPTADTAPLIPIYKRQKNVLNLAYWHTMIVAHRPFLLRNFEQLKSSSQSRRRRSSIDASKTGESITECLDAAMNIVNTVDDMFQAGQLFRAFWLTSYFAFSASVILYVYAIQKSNEHGEICGRYFDAAMRCQEQLASLVEDNSLGARYCVVLEELRTEALRQNNQHGADTAARVAFTAASDASVGPTHLDMGDLNIPDIAGMDGIYVTPTDSLADMTSWTQFEGMVSAAWDGLQISL